MSTKKLIIPLVLICFVFMLSACSSSKKQETPPRETSAGEQSPTPSLANAQAEQNNGQPVNNSQVSSEDVDVAAAEEKASQKGSAQSKPVATKEQPSQKSAANNSGAEVVQPVQNSQTDPAPAPKAENNASLPSKVYVFTNNSGCCEATRTKMAQHSEQVKTVESKYGSSVAFTWLDTGRSDVAYQKELQQIAKNFGVKSLPSIVVVDANGNVLLNHPGPLNMAEIDMVFGGLN
ncbi:MAG: hypothetical protein PHD36_07195 [Desulfotomaculaceae bacterium]|nr:hypothetical protein [Desulfotomaculaceae bacterium]